MNRKRMIWCGSLLLALMVGATWRLWMRRDVQML